MNWNLLHECIISFLLLLYAEPSLPRSIIDKIVHFMHNFIRNPFLISLENDILNIVENTEDKVELIIKVKDCFKLHGRVFENVITESERFTFFEKKGYTHPSQFKIQDTYVETLEDNDIVFDGESMYGFRVPLEHSLKFFLQIPGMFNNIIKYMNQLTERSNIVSNIIQAKFWRHKFLNTVKDSYLLPLCIYYDEIEVGNALGSHAGVNKFGVVYASIATLPPKIAAKLNSIIFALIIHAEDFKVSNNSSVFKVLIDELVYLYERGIHIVVDGRSINIKFQLVQIIGDNLGLNSICGFSVSFRAHYYCRICQASNEKCKKMCAEDKNLLRDVRNYDAGLLLNKVEITGLKENCTFNRVPNFHIAVNKSVDLMHDFLEGVCVYVIRAILHEYIFKKKYFTLAKLNWIIKNFQYCSEESNKPPKITLKREKEKLNLKFSASEMFCIMKYLSLMIGNIIPENDEHWKMYLRLRQISDILMSPRITKLHITSLSTLIADLNRSYLKLYKALKPKFHFLIHYPTILYYFGPVVHYWTMRYESKHRDIKANAQSSSSRVNLLKTVAKKQMLQFCHTVDTFTYNGDDEILFPDKKSINFYTKVKKNEIEYKVGSFIVISVEESEAVFGKIIKIEKVVAVSQPENSSNKRKMCEKIMIHVQGFQEVYFNSHLHAYVVERVHELDRSICISDIPITAPIVAVSIDRNDDLFHIIPKFIL